MELLGNGKSNKFNKKGKWASRKILSHTPHCYQAMRIMFVNRPGAIQVL